MPNNDTLDSILMIEYANFFNHMSTSYIYSLVKTMSYPMFLLVPTFLGISYNVLLSLYWILAGFLSTRALKKVTSHKAFLAGSYLFIIWAPIAFEAWGGVRIYRNAILVPSILCLISLLFLLTCRCLTEHKARPSTIFIAVATGILFFFTYYIKEDGFWMIPMVVAVMCICFVTVLVHYIRKSINLQTFLALIVVSILPFAIFQIGTLAYKAVNHHYYDVFEVNTRTAGELGNFVSNIYRIDSDDRTKYIWAPYDAIRQAFDASPTLASMSGLEEDILNNTWFCSNDDHREITGDFLGWVIRTSLENTGNWGSEAQVQETFAKVNDELDAAFENGTLVVEDKIKLTSSAGARSIEEIWDLADDTLIALTSPIFFWAYNLNADDLRRSAVPESPEATIYLLNQDVSKVSDEGLARIDTFKTKVGDIFAHVDFMIYRIIAPLLFITALIGFVWTIVGLITKRIKLKPTQMLALVTSALLFLMGLLYSFGISWFSEFLYEGDLQRGMIYLTFYGMGVIPMVYLSMLFSNALLVNMLFGKRIKSNERIESSNKPRRSSSLGSTTRRTYARLTRSVNRTDYDHSKY